MATDSRSLLEIAQRYSAPGLPIEATIVGVLPGLLMHSGESQTKTAQAAAEAKANGRRSKFIPEADQEAKWGAYEHEYGGLYLPTKNVHRCLVESAKAFKIPKSRASMKTVVAAGVTFPLEVGLGFDLFDPESNEVIDTYEVDVQRVVVQRNSIMRARPLVASWGAKLVLQIDPESIAPDTFAEILGHAGARVGLGDFRPEKGGQYGRFTITNLEVVEV